MFFGGICFRGPGPNTEPQEDGHFWVHRFPWSSWAVEVLPGLPGVVQNHGTQAQIHSSQTLSDGDLTRRTTPPEV